MIRSIIILILGLIAFGGFAQVGIVKRGFKQLGKEEFTKVEQLITRAFEKDSIYPGAFYLKSRLYFTVAYNSFDIDSAYQFVKQAQSKFSQLEEKDIRKLLKIDVGPLAMEQQKNKLDSAAFYRASSINTESSYIYFLKNFPKSSFEDQAINQRNARAFELALKINTYHAYRAFMDKYPEAEQYADASERYEKLYYYKSTADGKIRSYKRFLKQHATTPYRKEAEQKIFNIMTAANQEVNYTDFINEYPDSDLVKRAVNFLYHNLKQDGRLSAFPQRLLVDSLKKLNNLNGPLLLFLANKSYGFMDITGGIVIPPVYRVVKGDYLCGMIEDDWLIVGNRVVGLNGAELYSNVENAEDLGFGLLKIQSDKSFGVIHKSGLEILKPKYADIRLINGKFLAYQERGQWGLMTMSGIVLSKPQFHDIFELDGFMLFEKEGLYDVKIDRQLIRAADNNPIKFQILFDDYELLDNGELWLQSSYGQVVFDKQLNELIPYAKHEIVFLSNGYVLENEKGNIILNDIFQPINKKPFRRIKHNHSYLCVQEDSLWTLLKAKNYDEVGRGFKEVNLMGNNFVSTIRNDTVLVFFANTDFITLQEGQKISLISDAASSEFMQIDSKDEKVILNKSGEVMFSGNIDEVSALGDYIILTQEGQKGLASKGNMVLPFDYDAIGSDKEGHVTVLKDKKFGLFSEKYETLIAAEYKKRIRIYSIGKYIVQQENKQGFVNAKGESLSERFFDEVVYWQDSVALVKMEDHWKFYDFTNQELTGTGLRSFDYIQNTPEEIILLGLGEDGYGVLSNVHGLVISLTFNDIINIGRPGRPVYFAEKHIAEAEFYVVIYFDNKGKIIRKQAFEASEYDLIYCNQ